MSERKVRVRFAPSPTGPLHMGGIRTALYNYLFAKKNNGDFILRIEDTDQNRYVEGAEEYIIKALNWCKLSIDEGPGLTTSKGPYRQSERKHLYKKYVDQLIESGHAYYAFDSSEELTEMRELAKKAKMPNWQYNSITRNSMQNSLSLSKEEVDKRFSDNIPCAVRIKMPRNEDVRFFDEIRGWVVVNTNNMDDKVIYKADGMPTYHLANVVDDYLMEISHVIRGEEWLPSAPLHVLLYKYLDLEKAMPKFAHLPLILKPDGNGKLSKRDGDRLGFPVFPLQWTDPVTKEVSSGYREKGYFPESFVNMLAFLGWNPGNSKELYTIEELIKDFSLERVGKSGAKFDPEKSKWFNQQHLRNKSNSELAHLMLLDCKYNVSNAFLEKVANLMKERATFHHELLSEEYFFKIFEEYDEKTFRKKWKSNTLLLVNEFFADLDLVESFLSNQIENTFQKFIEKKEIGMGAILPCLRLILTGKGMGPSLFSIMELLGKQEVMHRYNIKSTLFENLFLEKSNS